jgi:putative transposase
MTVLKQHKPERLPVSMACACLDINRSSLYARHAPAIGASTRPRESTEGIQPRALSSQEREQVLSVLNSHKFCDQPPPQVYRKLLERGEYLCSVSTMYRLLREQGQSGERRNQRPAQHHAVPRLVATKPNQVWTWDITKLPLQQRGVYLCLYVVIDLFSRFVLAWMLSHKENSALSQQLMQQAIARYPEAASALTIHQDRGSPMIAHGYLDLLGELGATASHSRPRVSNDNAFSESQFKTLKYQPDYPRRFEHHAHAQRWCRDYFDWYNFQHHHSALAGYTPEQVFTERYRSLAITHQATMTEAYERHPERFVHGQPTIKLPPQVVAINPIYREDGSIETQTGVNFPTLPAAKEVANLH